MIDSELILTLSQRGFIYQCTDIDQLDKLVSQQSIVGYIGFDCTASSLHVGNLIQLMMLMWLEKLGHKPIILLGNSTSYIGDPSGKTNARPMLEKSKIELNLVNIQSVIKQFLPNAMFVYNSSWLEQINYLDFLRDYGSYFSINQMINYEMIKQRLSQHKHLSFLEFNYMLLQAYDFCHLAKKYDCRLQLGGSDQWGNIINGVELAKRLNLKSLYGITSPLITTYNGQKMGKTEMGAVWLSASQLSPFDYWQFWRNVADEDTIKFLKLFTFLPLSEISALSELKGKDINIAKKILANEATKICHGEEIAQIACNQASEIFEKTNHMLTPNQITIEFSNATSLPKLLVELGIVATISEAKRQIKNQAVKVNSVLVTDEFYQLDCMKSYQISFGKKKHFVIKFI